MLTKIRLATKPMPDAAEEERKVSLGISSTSLCLASHSMQVAAQKPLVRPHFDRQLYQLSFSRHLAVAVKSTLALWCWFQGFPQEVNTRIPACATGVRKQIHGSSRFISYQSRALSPLSGFCAISVCQHRSADRAAQSQTL